MRGLNSRIRIAVGSLSLFLASALPGFVFAQDYRETLPQPSQPMWTGGTYMDSLYATGAQHLHNIGITGYGVSAAVMDSPFDVTHEALKGKIIAEASAGISVEGNGLYRYTGNMTDMGNGYYMATGLNAVAAPGLTAESKAEYPAGMDFLNTFGIHPTFAHGTHVAGTVAAMAPGAGLVLVNTYAWTEQDPANRNHETLAGFAAADKGLFYIAAIAEKYNIVAMNNSWGDGTFAQFMEREAEFQDAINELHAAGVAPVFASGNSAMNEIGRPANYQNAYSVGALRPDGMVANFSDQPIEDISGRENILMAPGVTINSSVPYPDANGNSRYASAGWSGTSMASPHVTGAFTLLASGARNATLDQIAEALFTAVDIVPYDGDQMLERRPGDIGDDIFAVLGEVASRDPTIEFNIQDPGNGAIARSQDDWRELGRLRELIVFYLNDAEAQAAYGNVADFMVDILKNGEEENDLFPYLGPIGQTNFHVLRVDKAYRYLTDLRMNVRAEEVSGYGNAASAMLRAFGGELASELDSETSQIFQRLDAQSGDVLARVGRQMSPQWTSSAIEHGQLGVVGVHRSIGRRGDIARLTGFFEEIRPSVAVEVADCADALPCLDGMGDETGRGTGAAVWVEGFGGHSSRSGTVQRSDYSGHFAGSNVGLELRSGAFTFGLFGSIADYRSKGADGRSDGNWYSAGLYGRYDKGGFFGEASAAYTHASFKTNRYLDIPGAVFSTPYQNQFIVMAGESRRANAKNRMHGVSGRLSGGYDFEPGCGWYFGPRAEGSVVYGRVRGYNETGAGALDLSVNGFNQTYAEGGVGVGGAKVFSRPNGGAFIASAKVMGMYGVSFGGDMTGRYSARGSEFRFSPKRHSGLMVVPEASLTWRINDRVDLTATYAGRFGKKYSENSGSLKVGFGF